MRNQLFGTNFSSSGWRALQRAALLSIAVCPPCAAHAGGIAWPDGRVAAVSLAYDDALASQLDHAIPSLDKRGLKASFYLTLSSDTVRSRMDEWRAAAANGHELGNHSLFHQCAGSVAGHQWVVPHRDLDTTSSAQMKDQVLLANTMLAAIDGRKQRTFTPPCLETMARGENYVDLVKSEFVAIKLGDGAVTSDMSRLDPEAVSVEAPVGLTGAELIARVEDAARKHTMVNLTFHGIGGDYLETSEQAHGELLDYLASHQDLYWVDTFLNIMTFIRQQRESASPP